MSGTRHIKNIALVGFMGTGKSTVGRIVANRLGFQFFDTDEWIERTAGRKIPEIFATDGEARFRVYERELLNHLVSCEKLVISTGGGLVIPPGNLERLRKNALIVCLWSSPERIFYRVRGQSHRPLLQTEDPLARIRTLLAERAPRYRQADVLLNTELRTPREVAHQVILQLRARPTFTQAHEGKNP